MAEEREDKSRSPVLPPPSSGGKAPEARKATPRLPTPRLPTPRLPAAPRISAGPSGAPPRFSGRFSFAEWFRNSVPPLRLPLRRMLPRVRQSLLPMEDFVRRTFVPWVPRWKGWSPARTLTTTFGFGAFMFVLVLATPRSVKRFLYVRAAGLVPFHLLDPADAETEAKEGDRADAHMEKEHRSSAAGGVLTIPPAFQSADGQYDVILHFHGNTDLVEEEFAVSKLNAVVVILNLGIGSGPYEDRFANPDAFRDALERVNDVMARRGLREPKRHRVALTAWSAGYGAVGRVLDNTANADEVDSVLLMDGIHASFLADGSIDMLKIGPYMRFARRAIAGEKLFVITHSEIKPLDYPGTHATTDSVLQLVGLTREPGGEEPQFPPLESLHGVPKSKIVPLHPLTVVHAGNFHVYGYSGETPEDHIAHLVQMASTTLPHLAKRWEPAPRIEK